MIELDDFIINFSYEELEFEYHTQEEIESLIFDKNENF